VSVPGHIFILFNSGVHARRTFQLCCSEKDYYVYENEIWFPLETTWLTHSFCEAWQKGAEEMQQYSNDALQIINVRDSWVEYEPIAYTGKIVKSNWNFPQTELAQERAQLEHVSREYLVAFEKKVQQFPDSLALRNQLAITYAFQNQFDAAERHLRWLLAKDSSNTQVLNNLGNLYFLKGEAEQAHAYYQKALRTTEGDAQDGIRLNLALTYAAVDSDHVAVELFSEVLGDSMNYQKIENLLGISLGQDLKKQDEKAKSKKKINSNKVRELVRKTDNQRKKGSGRRSEKLGELGTKNQLPPEEIENVLYWAY
jgi:tetratricopeptide (TPR) repeat protein